MFSFLKIQKKAESSISELTQIANFDYLFKDQYYFDSACQTLRPQQVIEAENDYYHNYNACGERVKYKWGIQIDKKVEETRQKLLQLTGKSGKEYSVAFTLNTTYGINLVLQQLPSRDFDQIITSDIEHNSVFLPSITWSQKYNKKRKVLYRNDDGSIDIQNEHFARTVVLMNTVSNIDGRKLENLSELATKIQKDSGILLLDGAQHFSHDLGNLKKIDFDAIFGSGHKMYGPSIGFIIIKKSLLKKLDHFMLGGGTVSDVEKDNYQLINEDHELHATLELGLQNWAGIIGLGAAINWLKTYRPSLQTRKEYEEKLAQKLFEGLHAMPRIHLINTKPNSITSFYVDNLDAHRLALYLSEQNIMCRSGYFCCHYYLKNVQKYPPLLRVSLGLNNTSEQVSHLLDILHKILNTF